MSSAFTHLDEQGNARMVDVGYKNITNREAIAIGIVKMKKETIDCIVEKKLPKGDVLSVAQIAGIMGAKKTSELIPLCHPIMLSAIDLKLEVDVDNNLVRISACVKTSERTGVEMEALTAVSISALTLYDMCKAIDKEIEISSIFLTKKTGGKSGTFIRNENI